MQLQLKDVMYRLSSCSFAKWKVFVFLLLLVNGLIVLFTGSFFIQPTYKSTAIIYPVNFESYSDESATEQMLQILNSESFKHFVIDSMNLCNHYLTCTNEKCDIERAARNFDRRYSAKKTRFESVKIEVSDESPEFSVRILHAILKNYNKVKLNLYRKNANEVLIVKEKLYLEKQLQIDSIKKIINLTIKQNNLMEYGLLKESQIGSFPGLPNKTTFKLFCLQTEMESELKNLQYLKTEYEKALSNVSKKISFLDIISSPLSSEKNTCKIRMFLLFCCNLILASGYLLIFGKY